MIGRPYQPTDVDNEFGITGLLGYDVKATDENGAEVFGTLCNVHHDGMATLEQDGFVSAIVKAQTVRPNLYGAWSA